jgi:hypothetical protein
MTSLDTAMIKSRKQAVKTKIMKFSVKQWLAEPRVLGGKRIFAIAYVLKH